jgi:homoserine O-succinyltransferase
MFVSSQPSCFRPLAGNSGPSSRPLTIGLVNNMGDASLLATERQFSSILNEAGGGADIVLQRFELTTIARSPEARVYLDAHYAPAAAVRDAGVDALIITGAQPRAPDLRDEPYWGELAALLDWARDNSVAMLLSCLAAHAGVLHFDGVARRRLPGKRTGVYEFAATRDHPLVGARGALRRTPHSRYNEMNEADLERAGYEVLSRTPDGDVDAFIKGDLCLFLQGHPEYDPGSLGSEFRRDMGRFLGGKQDHAPLPPDNYFPADIEAAAHAFRSRSLADPRPGLMSEFPDLAPVEREPAPWRRDAVDLYRGWIDMLAACRAAARALQTATAATP